jgi:cytochrome c-type biogenesis protein CcmH
MTDTVEVVRQELQRLRALHASGGLSDAQYAKSRSSLERKLVDHVLDGPVLAETAASPTPRAQAATAARPGGWLWVALGGFAVLLAAAGYWWTGSPDHIGQAPPGFGSQSQGGADDVAGSGAATGAPHALDKEQFTALIERLAARLKEQPDDAEGWTMLGRSYMALGRQDEGLAAFERAIKLRPDDATGLADYADALAMKNGRSLEGEPTRLIERALKLDPDNLKALTLAGTVAFNGGDYAKAAQYWDRAAKVGPADSPIVQQARAGAAEARELGKLPATAPAGAGGKAPSATTTGPAAVAVGNAGTLAGTVTLAPALKGKVAAEDSVFIFARPAEGSRMPLAFLRKQVKDLPFTFQLDDSLAMSPAAKLSTTAGPVVVGARISKTGQAMPQPGDLQGLSGAIAVGSTGVAVVIADEVK